MNRIKYYLKLLFVPLSLLALYISLSFLWKIFSLPPAVELAELVRGWFDTYGLPILFLSSIVESMLLVGSYFPGVFVIFIGVLLAKSITQAIVVVAVATAGLVIGHILSYLLGRYGWYNLLVKFGLQSSVEAAKVKLLKKGPMAIFFSYWLPSAGALTDTAAGIIGMSFKTFLVYSFVSAVFWDSLVGLIVYKLGDKALVLAAPGSQGDMVVYIIISVWLLWILISDYRTKRFSI